MPTHLALLRAINIGGRRLAMADLRAFFHDLGFADARTLLQTGNVVFTAGNKEGRELEAWLQGEALRRLQLDTDFLIRTSAEWGEAIAGNPFPEAARDDPAHLVLMALNGAPEEAALDGLRAAIRGREQVGAHGAHLYITYPDGIGDSKLTNAVIERKLGLRGTARNWNTTLKLAALAEGGDRSSR